MKRIPVNVFIVFFGCFCSATFLRADPQANPPPVADGIGAGRPMPNLMEKLGLTEDQNGKLQAEIKANSAALGPLHQQINETLKKLDEQLKNKSRDKDIQSTLDQLEALRKSMVQQQDQFNQKVSLILTPTQHAKMLMAQFSGMQHGGRGMRGMGGPGMHGMGGGTNPGQSTPAPQGQASGLPPPADDAGEPTH